MLGALASHCREVGMIGVELELVEPPCSGCLWNI